MPPFNAMSDSIAKGMNAYFELATRAREIDPDAFKGFNVRHFTDEESERQRKAFDQAAREKAKA